MDKAKVDQAVEQFVKALPERPEWVVIVDRSGQFVTRVGHYTWRYGMQLTDEIATTYTHKHGINQIETLDKLNHGNLQYSMSFGSDYVLFLFNLNDAFFMSLCFEGVASFDAIIEGFRRNFGIVTEALWYS
jgi:hypothetical protein